MAVLIGVGAHHCSVNRCRRAQFFILEAIFGSEIELALNAKSFTKLRVAPLCYRDG